jgi:hypothetical protein
MKENRKCLRLTSWSGTDKATTIAVFGPLLNKHIMKLLQQSGVMVVPAVLSNIKIYLYNMTLF